MASGQEPVTWRFDAVRAEARAFSKTLFGNADRLEVAWAIRRAHSDVVFAAQLSDELGIARNRVRAQLIALAECGFLVELPRVDNTVMFEKQQSFFWDAIARLGEERGWQQLVRLV
jgi:hypothetical protein